MMDKEKAAEKLKELLEGRIARLLGCEPEDLPKMRLGSMVHFLFLAQGDAQTMPGFGGSFRVLLDILGNEAVWAEPQTEETEKVVVN